MEEKRRVRRIKIAFVLIVLFCTVLCGALNADILPCKLKLQQICTKYPELVVFANLLDADGNPMSLSAEIKPSAKIDGKDFTPTSLYVYSRDKEGSAIVYVIDVSSAVSDKVFAETKEAISAQIKKMSDRDYAAIVSAGETAQVLQNLTNKKEALLATLERLKQNGQRAELNESIMRALDLVSLINSELPERRLVIIGTAELNYSASAITDDEIRRKVKSTRVPIYSVVCEPTGKIATDVKKIRLGELSRLSGGDFYRNEINSFSAALSDIWHKIDRTAVFRFDISAIKATGSVHQLNIVCKCGKNALSDNAQFSLSELSATVKKADSEAARRKKKIVFVCSAFMGLLLVLLCYLLLKHRKAKNIAEDNAAACKDISQNASVTEPRRVVENATIRMPVSNREGITHRVQPMHGIASHGLSVEFYRTGSSVDQRVIKGIISTHTIVGRKVTSDNCIVISGDSSISAKHCELSFVGGKLHVTDLQSTNGTFVNGVAINSVYPLKDGDLLTIGRTEMRVKICGNI